MAYVSLAGGYIPQTFSPPETERLAIEAHRDEELDASDVPGGGPLNPGWLIGILVMVYYNRLYIWFIWLIFMVIFMVNIPVPWILWVLLMEEIRLTS